MKSFFWFSVVDTSTDTFVHAAAIIANGYFGAAEKASTLGIYPKPNLEIACFPMPWEERHNYKGYMDRLLTEEEVRALNCKKVSEWEKEGVT